MSRSAVVAIALVTALTSTASAQELSTRRRIAAVAAAIFPGLLVHGAGSYVAGQERTAKRLFLAQVASTAAITTGGIAVGATGGSPYLLEPGVPLLLAGVGGLLVGWASDVWVAAGGSDAPGHPLGLPPWSIEVGTTYQHDAYRERGYARLGAELAAGPVALHAATLLDAEGEARLGELAVRARLLGATASWTTRGRPLADGSALDVRVVGRAQRDDADDVTLVTAEATIGGRVDLRHVDGALAGTFAELATGLGAQRITYARGRHDVTSLMLGTFAWGVYLGERGEATVSYDHRRDSLAGGLAASRAAGFVGSFGANTTVRVGGPWAVHAALERR
ncbi:MAG: hypothetical protein NT062_31455, partial [Proteobacteria bacterium]|nr:hypothetical protein [Pseudomonadota bacterium]